MTRARIGTDAISLEEITGNPGGNSPEVQPFSPRSFTSLGEDVVVYESNLEDGTSPDADALTKEIAIPEGWRIDVDNDQWNPTDDGTYTRRSEMGHFTVSEDGRTLSYTLRASVMHGEDNDVYHETGGVVVLINDQGEIAEVPLSVQIQDDKPVLSGDYESTTINPGDTYDGSWDVNFGADSEGGYEFDLTINGVAVNTDELVIGVPFEVVVDDVSYGHITISASDRYFSVTAAEGLTEKVEASLEVKVRDGDGDVISTGPIVLTIEPKEVGGGDGDDEEEEPDLPVLGGELTFSEANLANGTNPKPEALTQEVELPEGYKLVFPEDSNWKASDDGATYILNGKHGYYTASADGSSLTYTLTTTITNDNSNGSNNTATYEWVSGIYLSDDAGKISIVASTIKIRDDVPTVVSEHNDSASLEPGDSYSGKWQLNFGADGKGELDVIVTINDQPVTFSASSSAAQELVLDGVTYGTLKFNSDGTFSFKAAEGQENKAVCKVVVLATDGDGDTTKSEALTVTVNDGGEVEPPSSLGSGVLFSEANLADGTAPAADALVQSIHIPNGYSLVVSDDSKWQHVGNNEYRLYGKYGYLTASTDGKSLTYTLTNPAQNGKGTAEDDSLIDSIAGLKLRGEDGTITEVPANITIRDDAPQITTESGPAPVIDAGATHVGDMAINFGADGQGDISAQISINGKEFTTDHVVVGRSYAIVIDGVSYGNYSINSDGTYSLKPAANLTGTLNFSLKVTATDGDGDTVTSNPVSVTVKGETPPLPEALGEDLVFYESHLTNGTTPDPNALVQKVALPDGYTVVFGDHPQWTLNEDNGTYTLKGAFGYFTASADGAELTYTLSKAVNNDNSGSNNMADLDWIPMIELSDPSGEIISLPASIKIFDDAPVITDEVGDDPVVTQPGASVTADMEIVYGADGRGDLTVEVSVNGTPVVFTNIGVNDPQDIYIADVFYGTLTVTDQGCVIQTAADLKGSHNFSVKATATDGDGDKSSSSLHTFTVQGEGDPTVIGSDTFVSEANLANGTAPDSEALVQQITLPDGYAISFEGDVRWEFGNGEYLLHGEYGIFIASANGKELVYVLTTPAQNAVGTANDNFVFEKMQGIQLVDGQGRIIEVETNIRIDDDAPVFNIEHDDESQVKPGESFEGNWDVQFGADGEGGVELVIEIDGEAITLDNITFGQANDVVINGTNYGTLTINANGTFVITPSADLKADYECSLVIKATDGDGDTVSSVPLLLVIKGEGGSIEIPEALGDNLEFSEAHLANGTAPDTDALVQDIDIPDGFSIVFENDDRWEMDADGNYLLYSEYGYLFASADGRELRYTLTDPIANNNSNGNQLSGLDLIPAIQLLGEDGEIYEVPVSIKIYDDEPVITVEANKTQIEAGDTVTGTWDVNFGADLEEGFALEFVVDRKSFTPDAFKLGEPVEVTIDGVYYGSITVNKDGTFLIESSAELDKNIDCSLKITAVDGDGDSVSETIGLTIQGGQDVPDPYMVEVSESHLENGTAPDAAALTQNFGNLGVRVLTELDPRWVQDGDQFVLTTEHGKYILSQDRMNMSYVLNKAAHNDINGTVNNKDTEYYDTLTLMVEDENGRMDQREAIVVIRDDEPVLQFDTTPETIKGGEEYTGEWNVNFGADGAAEQNALGLLVSVGGKSQSFALAQGASVVIEVDGVNYGTLTLQDGSYSFVSTSGHTSTNTLSFVLQATDSDGDMTSSAPFNLVVKGDTPQPPTDDVFFESLYFDEANLANGTSPDAGKTTKVMALPEGYTVDTTGWTDSGSGIFEFNTPEEPSFFKFTYDSANGQLSCTLLQPTWHLDDNRDGAQGTGLTYIKVVDANGDVHNTFLPVFVADDAPVLEITPGNQEIAAGEEHIGTWDLNYGADGASYFPVLRLTAQFGSNKLSVHEFRAGSALELYDGDDFVGTITFAQDGSYSFVSSENCADQTINFTLTAMDYDLTVVSKNFAVTIADGGEPVDPEEPTPSGETLLLDVIAFDESAFPGGTAPSSEGLVQEVTIQDGYTVYTKGWEEHGNGIFSLKPHGEASTFELTYDGEKLTCTILKPVGHYGAVNELSLILDSIKFLNADNKIVDTYLPITVVDDDPDLSVSAPEYNSEDNTYYGTWEAVYGADGPANAIMQVTLNAPDYRPIVVGIQPGAGPVMLLSGTTILGWMTIDNDGSYSIQPTEALKTAGFDLSFTIMDADGDIASVGRGVEGITDPDPTDPDPDPTDPDPDPTDPDPTDPEVPGGFPTIINGTDENDVIVGPANGNNAGSIIYGVDGDDLIYAGGYRTVMYGGDGADTFAWHNPADWKAADVVKDFSISEGDKLSFSELLGESETLAAYLDGHMQDLRLTDEGTLRFNIVDSGKTADIRIEFNSDDAGFAAVHEQYTAADGDLDAQQAILSQLLATMTS